MENSGTSQQSAEMRAALTAVRAASRLCAGAQGRIVGGDTLTKGDESPVTIADFAAQAVVCGILTSELGPLDLVGEETPDDLRDPAQAMLLGGVTDLVRQEMGADVDDSTVLEWIGVGSADGSSDRYWTLDPIDGTKGFLRGDQYAIALALIEHGEVVLGVLGCPNLPNPDGSTGAIFAADAAFCGVWPGDRADAQPARVASPLSVAEARFCESVESGHSDQGQSAAIASKLGIRTEPYRIDSQCKYGAVSRGDASIYLRLPTRADYREKIWDHAAGMFIVQRAGGHVTDVDGRPLDFGHGRRLEHNRGIIATDGRFHDQVVEVVQQVLHPADD